MTCGVYQELLWELRPGLVVETGTAHGGSALYLATTCGTIGHGQVVSVDIGHWPDRPAHPRLTYLTASSTDPEVVAQVAERARGAGPVLVVLDSDHSRDHVLAELRAYAPGHPGQLPGGGGHQRQRPPRLRGLRAPGRWRPSRTFLKERDDFEADRSREKFLFTFNPGGWLRKLG